ncbi:carcinoembryonic antigen-related cell adhesion molecule 1 isoform X2 [Apodemus sylvaticus]|uniref:carcinoembryonic antigen-related cell adhesion molecule 1 isoform X2 n=1 Tax=Apodemus sylvaticus TaxID=10129 RepID=UPI002241AB7B|nr:carcinoembryonic antigen-related cell adhesion molecule 1 isoform X2 [Apodemus sylvaticus]
MELASAHRHRGQIPWRGLLLTASLLTSWSLPTTAQVTIEAVPPAVAEGKDVLLLVHNLPQTFQVFYWYKGTTTTDVNNEIGRFVTQTNRITMGPASSGRETIYTNGSLFIQSVTKNDEGVYTLDIIDPDYNHSYPRVQFSVHAPLPKPNITSNNSNPVEGEDSVSLTCESYANDASYQWSRNGESLSEGDRLMMSDSNRTLILINVTRNDTGPYECETWNLVSANRSDPFYLNITYGPDTPIISPSDIYLTPGSNLSLSCHAASNPPAQYFWLTNEKPQASSQELFIPNITTNHSGTYTCFVNNSVTGLSRSTDTNVTVLEEVTPPSIQVTNTTVKEMGSVTLTCLSNDTGISIRWLFNHQSLQLMERMTLSQDNSTLTIHPIRKGDAGVYQCEISNPVSFKISNPIQLEVIADPTPGDSGLSGGAIAGIVIGSVAGVALIAALIYFLYSRKTGGSGSF